MRIVLLLTVTVLISSFSTPTRALEIQEVTADNGLTAWLVEDHSLPIISLSAVFKRAGIISDPEQSGAPSMMAAMLSQGAGPYSSQEFQQKLYDNAIQLSFNSGIETVSVRLQTLKENRDIAFDLMSLALSQPRFEAEELEKIRTKALAGLKTRLERPGYLANRTWTETYFGDHPYARPANGTLPSLATITADDLKALHRQRLGRDNLILAVVGSITPEELKEMMVTAFKDLPAAATLPELMPPQTNSGFTQTLEKDVPQTVLIFGQPGLMRDHPDYFKAALLNQILGAGGGNPTRLYASVREREGLTYSISTYLAPYEAAGLLMGQTSTATETVGRAQTLIRKEWRRLQENGPTSEEVKDAKTYLIGSFALNLDSTLNIARILSSLKYYELGIDYLETRKKALNAITPQELTAFAKSFLQPEALSFVIVGRRKPQNQEEN